MKPIVFIFFLALVPFFSCTRFLQLFDTLENENSNPNGYHSGEVKIPTPSIMDYVKASDNNNTDPYSFKQIPDEIPMLSVIVPKNDDYLKDSFVESENAVDVSSLESQAESLIHEESNGQGNNMEMGTALKKTKEFIEKALRKDMNVGVSKDDLMNLLSFSNKILDKCNGDFANCEIEKRSQDDSGKGEGRKGANDDYETTEYETNNKGEGGNSESKEDNGKEDNVKEDNGKEDNGKEDNGKEDNGKEDNGKEDNGKNDNGKGESRNDDENNKDRENKQRSRHSSHTEKKNHHRKK